MGIYFSLEFANPRIDYKKFVNIIRDSTARRLFEEEREKIIKLSGKNVNIDFFTKADQSALGNPVNKDLIFDPNEIKKTLNIIMKTLKDYENQFPYFYWVTDESGNNGRSSDQFYIKNKIVHFSGYFDGTYCTVDNKSSDINSWLNKKIKANKLYYTNNKGPVKGDKIIIRIIKQSMHDFYKKLIKDMINVCDYAIKNNSSIKSSLG